MARRRNFPWIQIKEAYINFCDLKGICDEFGIPYATLRSRIRRKGWYRERTQMEKDVLERCLNARMEDEGEVLMRFREGLYDCLLQIHQEFAEKVRRTDNIEALTVLMCQLMDFSEKLCGNETQFEDRPVDPGNVLLNIGREAN